jgi:hypothetical protein
MLRGYLGGNPGITCFAARYERGCNALGEVSVRPTPTIQFAGWSVRLDGACECGSALS